MLGDRGRRPGPVLVGRTQLIFWNEKAAGISCNQKFRAVVKSIKHLQCPCLRLAGWTLHCRSPGTPLGDPCLCVHVVLSRAGARFPAPARGRCGRPSGLTGPALGGRDLRATEAFTEWWRGHLRGLQGEDWAGAGSEAVWGSPVLDTAQRRASRRASRSRSWEQPLSRGPSSSGWTLSCLESLWDCL